MDFEVLIELKRLIQIFQVIFSLNAEGGMME